MWQDVFIIVFTPLLIICIKFVLNYASSRINFLLNLHLLNVYSEFVIFSFFNFYLFSVRNFKDLKRKYKKLIPEQSSPSSHSPLSPSWSLHFAGNELPPPEVWYPSKQVSVTSVSTTRRKSVGAVHLPSHPSVGSGGQNSSITIHLRGLFLIFLSSVWVHVKVRIVVLFRLLILFHFNS